MKLRKILSLSLAAILACSPNPKKSDNPNKGLSAISPEKYVHLNLKRSLDYTGNEGLKQFLEASTNLHGNFAYLDETGAYLPNGYFSVRDIANTTYQNLDNLDLQDSLGIWNYPILLKERKMKLLRSFDAISDKTLTTSEERLAYRVIANNTALDSLPSVARSYPRSLTDVVIGENFRQGNGNDPDTLTLGVFYCEDENK